MSDTYFFAGGMYYKKGSYKDVEFAAVRPSGNGLPYVTTNPRGLWILSSHSSLYKLSDDFKTAFLYDHRYGGVIQSPKKIELPEKLQQELKDSITKNGTYND